MNVHKPAPVITALDLAWEEINALGGPSSNDDFDGGISFAVTHALQILERLGARDPAPIRAEAGQ